MKHEPVMCTAKYHKNEPVEYYCQECEQCICLKCGQTRHNHHNKMDIQQAAEDEKMQMTQVFHQAKIRVANIETKMKEQIELMEKNTDEISAAEKKMTETVEEIIRIAREHETAIKTELAEIKEAKKRDHLTKMKKFQQLAAEIKSSVQHGEEIVQRNIAPEILQAGHAVVCCCKKLSNSSEIKIYNPQQIGYRVNIETMKAVRRLVLGRVVFVTDSSQSLAEGKGLKEAELGAETNFTISTRDSEGNQSYDQQDQVTVKIRSPTGEFEKKEIEDYKDGNYTVRYKPKSVGLHDITVELNGQPLTGSPWSVQVTGHQYKALHSFGSRGKETGEFNRPWSIAVNERTGNIAVADYENKRVQLFDSESKYLTTIGDKGPRGKRIKKPMSVAFTASGYVIVIHKEDFEKGQMFLFTEHGQFINHIRRHLSNAFSVSVRTDGHMIVCDCGDKSVKVLSPEGTELLQSFSAPDSIASPLFAVYHQDLFFVSYGGGAHRVKVFSKESVFLYDIGCEGSGDGQLKEPGGLTIDKFNNLIVCDKSNNILQVFSLDGKFVNSVNEGLKVPYCIAINKDGNLLVCDWSKHCIHVFNKL